MSSIIGQLRISLGLETAAFERGSKRAAAEVNALGSKMDKAGLAVGRLGKTIAAGAAAIGGAALAVTLKDLVMRGLDYASSLGETAQQLGVTTDALQEYRYAASQVGIEQETMDASLAKLTKSIGEAAAGSKTQAAAFAELGISLRDANGNMLTAGDAIPQIAEALSKIPDPAARARIETDLFGKSGQKLDTLLSQGAAGVNGLRDAAQKLGVVLSSEQIQKADDTADKLSALKQVLEAQIAGQVANNADSILELANAFSSLVTSIGGAIKAWKQWRIESNIRMAENTRDGWFTSSAGRADAQRRINALVVEQNGVGGNDSLRMPKFNVGGTPAQSAGKGNGTGKFTPLSGTYPGAKPMVPGLRKSNLAGDSLRGWLDPSSPLNFVSEATVALPAQFKRAESAVSASATSMIDTVAAQLRRLDGEMVGPARSSAERVTQIFETMARETRSLMADLFPEVEATQRYRNEKALVENSPAFAAVRDEAMRRLNAKYTTPGDNAGWFEDWVGQGDGAVPVVLDEVNAALTGLQDNHKKVTGELVANNDNAARSFREMSDDVLGSLQGLVSGIQSGDFLSILQGVVGVLESLASVGLFGKSMADTVNKNKSSRRGYAVGTNYAARGLALVGERGPELMQMRGGERVIPNHQLGGLGGGGIAQIVPSKYFDVVVDGRIINASPGIMQGGAKVAATQSRWKQSRSIGR